MFLHLPVDGYPQKVNTALKLARVSDLIGGIPALVVVSDQLGIFHREDFWELPLNQPASYLASLGQNTTFPIPGDAVVVGLEPGSFVILDGAPVQASAGNPVVPLDGRVADGTFRLARDVYCSVNGYDDQVEPMNGQAGPHRAGMIRTFLGYIADARNNLSVTDV